MSPKGIGWRKEYKWVRIYFFFKNLIHQVNIFNEYLSCLKYKNQQCSSYLNHNRSDISSTEMICTKYDPNSDGCAKVQCLHQTLMWRCLYRCKSLMVRLKWDGSSLVMPLKILKEETVKKLAMENSEKVYCAASHLFSWIKWI